MKVPERATLSEDKYMKLLEKIKSLNIDLNDIDEKFVKGGGKGGQKINKTTSCVHLKYIPLNIEVKSQKTRERSLNRVLALRDLIDKIEYKILGRDSTKSKKIEKIRKQKKKRARRAKLAK